MGLLSKASGINLSKKLAFNDFIVSHNLKTAAIFNNENNSFIIKNSIGFDIKSIINSKSTLDFWNGICTQKNKVYNFSKEDNSINSLLQFFSFSMNEKIENISLYHSNEDSILMVINNIIDSSIITDFLNINLESEFKYNLPSSIENDSLIYLYELNFSDSLSDYDLIFKDSIKNEIFNRFSNFYFSNSCSIDWNNNLIRVFKFAPEDFDSELLIKHIKLNINEIDENLSSKIKINFINSTKDLSEVDSIMKAE